MGGRTGAAKRRGDQEEKRMHVRTSVKVGSGPIIEPDG
jgi:hypothetical protein